MKKKSMLHATIGLMLSMSVWNAHAQAVKPIDKDGNVANALVLGSFESQELRDAAEGTWVDPQSGKKIKLNAKVDGKPWQTVASTDGIFDLTKAQITGPNKHATAYLSFWVYSPKKLSNVSTDASTPVVNLELSADDAAQAYLNGELVSSYLRQGSLVPRGKVEPLKLNQGWNHLLIKAINLEGAWKLGAKLSSSSPEYLAELQSSLERP